MTIKRLLFLLFQLSFVVAIAILLFSFKSKSVKEGSSSKIPKDSIDNATYIKNIITYSKIYDFINYNLNYIQWKNREAIVPFYDKLKQAPTRKLRILHIGDSHIQADYFTGYVRDEMQRLFGLGGRGFVFPYAAAETHSAYDYRTYCSGNWQYSRNIQSYPTYDIGITGATIHTTDSTATFSIVFKSSALKANFNLLKLYCKQSPESYDIKLLASGVHDTINITCNQQNNFFYVPILLANKSDTLEFFIHKSNLQQSFFECYGLLIETNDNSGVLYSSVGINGAGYRSMLKETLLANQLSDYNPDLVIIDLGANDFYGYTLKEYELETNLKKIIDIIKNAAPFTSIIVSNSQDLFKRKRNITECQPFSALTRKVAFEKNCGFFDYYNISGGKLSMLKWSKNNLAQRDRVHLSGAGYYIKGELVVNAILNSYYLLLSNDSLKQFVLDYNKMDSLRLALTENKNKDKPSYYQNEIISYKPKNTKVNSKTDYYYSIKPGDNLGKIAEDFGVSINSIKDWNNLGGNKIIAGEVLLIHPKKNIPKSSSPTTNKTQPITNSSGNKTYYTVKSGENLWMIAQKFGVTVENIQNWSNLSGDAIKPGDILVVYAKSTNVVTVKPNQPKNIPVTPNKNQVTYKVVSGDNLWSIAKKYNVSVESIKKLNNLQDDKLKLGKILIIK